MNENTLLASLNQQAVSCSLYLDNCVTLIGLLEVELEPGFSVPQKWLEIMWG